MCVIKVSLPEEKKQQDVPAKQVEERNTVLLIKCNCSELIQRPRFAPPQWTKNVSTVIVSDKIGHKIQATLEVKQSEEMNVLDQDNLNTGDTMVSNGNASL